jgi:hypothetical protein
VTVFVEDPWSRIVAVHWEDDGEPEPPEYGPPYCGRYGYGAIMADTGTLITAIPYGPNQLPPMVGTYATSGPHGGINHPLPGNPETLTAAPYGLIAQTIWLGANHITFTNNQLIYIPDQSGNIGSYGWIEHMATGHTAPTSPPGVPLVVKSYTINMEWVGHWVDPLDECGLGFTHPIPGWSGAIPRPSEPAVVLGSDLGGSASFFYDFKAEAYWNNDIHVTEENQFDPGLGGPAYVWWMSRRKTGTGYTVWGSTSQFMVTTIVGLGDHYTWEIIADCQPFPASHP